MTAENFDLALSEVLAFEGGYVNDPRDPGGETNFGISKRAYPAENIKAMTRERASAIYRRDYWRAVAGDDLPGGVDLAVFDAAVNSGPGRAIRWLQRALVVPADGVLGPKTMDAARAADPAVTVKRMTADRLAYLKGLATWARFGKGWARRVDSIRAAGLELARGEPVPNAYAEWLAAMPKETLAWLNARP